MIGEVSPLTGTLPSLDEMEKLNGLSNITDAKLDKMSREIRWGSFGKSGKDPIKYKFMCDLDTDHIENILTYCWVSAFNRKILLYVLKNRYKELALQPAV